MSNESHRKTITDIVNRISEAMNVSCRLEFAEELQADKKFLNVAVYAPDQAHFLIGKNGQNLQALEHLIRAAVLKDSSEAVTIGVDVNDYKKTKSSQIVEMARQAVEKVRNTRRAEALAPMSSYERRVVHMELASMPDIITESIGQEPQRRIVVKLL